MIAADSAGKSSDFEVDGADNSFLDGPVDPKNTPLKENPSSQYHKIHTRSAQKLVLVDIFKFFRIKLKCKKRNS